MNNNTSNNFTTACGIKPTDNLYQFVFSTGDVESFIRGRFKQIENVFKSQGQNPPHIVPELSNLKLGGNLGTFLLTMPMDVLKGNNVDHTAPPIFTNHLENGDCAEIKPYYMKTLQPWMYSKEDRKEFNDPRWKREARIKNWTSVDTLKRFATPKTEQLDQSRNDYEPDTVVLLLSPVRVFHTMVKNPNNPQEVYKVFIDDMKEGTVPETAIYTITRQVIPRKNRGNVNVRVIQELLRHRNAMH